MQSIKILVPIYTTPNVKSAISMIIENLSSALSQKVNVHIVWFVYSPDKLDVIPTINEGETILDIHDFYNAIEVVQKEKPDIIYASPFWDPIDYAFSLAGKMTNIPVLDLTISGYSFTRSKAKLIKSYLTRFFDSYVPTDTSKNKKQFMRRGRFFIYKHLFLLRTQRAINISWFKVIQKFLMIMALYISNNKAIFDSRFANTVHFLDSEILLKAFHESGFEKSTLVVIGNPMYDEAFRKISQMKDTRKGNQIRVLFAPSTLYEHGFWTKNQRDTAVRQIVKNILNYKNEISLLVKIHPSSSVLTEYQSIINSIDPTIPVYQKGDIQDFLSNYDVLISFKFTTAEIYAVLARKPVIICNFFNEESDMFVTKGLVNECKEPTRLVELIRKSFDFTPTYEKIRQDFIQEFMYKWDGRAAERMAEKILTLLNTKHKPTN